MIKFNLLGGLIVLMLLVSCDKAPIGVETSSDPKTLTIKRSFPFNEPKITDQKVISQLRSYALDLITKRQENMKEDLFDLTYYYVSPRGFSNLNKVTGQQAYTGYWAKFDKDYTYQYGIRDQVIGDGVYHYAGSDTKLFMLDNDRQIEPKMWNIKSNSEFFNFLGRPIIVVEDASGHGQLLMSNFSNDGFLNTQKIIVQSGNGTQIMMLLLEQKPS